MKTRDYILLICLISSLISCISGQDDPDSNADVLDIEQLLSDMAEIKDIELELRKVNDDYKYFLVGDTMPFFGQQTIRYNNYQVKSIHHYKDGELDSLAIEYNPNGNIKSKGNFTNSRRNGLWTQWYSNGQLESSVEYNNDKKKGIEKSYYQNGQLMSIINYQDDKRHGNYESWYENGQKMMVSTFIEDKEQPEGQYWNEDGEPLEIDYDSNSTGIYTVTVTDSIDN